MQSYYLTMKPAPYIGVALARLVPPTIIIDVVRCGMSLRSNLKPSRRGLDAQNLGGGLGHTSDVRNYNESWGRLVNVRVYGKIAAMPIFLLKNRYGHGRTCCTSAAGPAIRVLLMLILCLGSTHIHKTGTSL